MWSTLSGSVAAQSMSLKAESGLPPAREFLTSAGFGGLAALLAAIIVAAVLLAVSRNAGKHRTLHIEELEHHHNEILEDQQRAAALARCWRRLEWVVDTAGIEPASSQGVTLGLGPELATEILRGILREADELGDEALGSAATVHLSQLALVLAQQSGSLTRPAPAKPTASENASGSASPAETTNSEQPESAATPPTDDSAQAPARTARARRAGS